jgi:signal transduction histidine kinase
MGRISIGRKLYFSVLSLFVIFTVAFIIFQQAREKEYKIEVLNMKLQDYNSRLNDAITYSGNHSEKVLNELISTNTMPKLRITLINRNGKVIYDNIRKDYNNIANHANRKEVREALRTGSGYDIERNSRTLKGDFFYSATYFPQEGFIIRSALPYNNDLSKSLQADQHYIWFALITIIILIFILYRFTSRLDSNITKLRIFAKRADSNVSLDSEELAEFSDDDLGEIAEQIVKMYMRLEKTKKEQDILKRQLTQNIAHELKTPVASIQGYLETILDNTHIDEENKNQFLQRCYAQSQRLTSLLQDISTLNRIDDAPDLIGFEQVNISNIVTSIIKETSLQLEERHITFQNDLRQDITVMGNQSLLYSVFRNLTDNAIAYSGEGTTIHLWETDETDHLHFTFSDNGVGVKEEHLARLFERFYRVDKGRSRKMGGTGLGLAIVKNAIMLHHGSISVKNNPEGGLRFDFTIKK